MPRQMLDSVTSADIPQLTPLVAGYVDGIYAWTYNDWARHGSAILVRITVTGNTLDAHVADVENGDLTPDQGAAWMVRKIARGDTPCLYFSRSAFGAVHAAALAAGVQDNQWTQWVADWTCVAPTQAIVSGQNYAIQYGNPACTGGHYDISLVADYWPGIDPPPVPAPTPTPTPPPPPPPPPPSPSPLPAASDIDRTRTAWAGLADFFTSTLPGAIAELLRLLGLFQKTP